MAIFVLCFFMQQAKPGSSCQAPCLQSRPVDRRAQTLRAQVRNMRLGMLSFLGFAVQAWVTGCASLACCTAVTVPRQQLLAGGTMWRLTVLLP